MARLVDPEALTQVIASSAHNLPIELVHLVQAVVRHLRTSAQARSTYGSYAHLWPAIDSVWQYRAPLLLESAEARTVCEQLAMLAASLCINNAHNQDQAVVHLLQPLRCVLKDLSSFHASNDPAVTPLTLASTRLLANVVAANERSSQPVLRACLDLDMQTTGSDALLQRLLASSSVDVRVAVLVLMLNATQSYRPNLDLFADTVSGQTVLRSLLDLFAETERHDGSDKESLLVLAFVKLGLQDGRGARLFDAVSSGGGGSFNGPQITWLKLVDGILDAHLGSEPRSSHSRAALVPAFSIVLQRAATKFRSSFEDLDQEHALAVQASVLALSGAHSLCMSDGAVRAELTSSLEAVVDTLRFCARLTSKGSEHVLWQDSAPDAILQLQRKCVALISALSCDNRANQDEVRKHGGLPLVVALSRMDERNLTMREHALLAIRHLVQGNPENQQSLRELAPAFRIGPDGEMREIKQDML
ncbi:hypothetical protein ACM66B_002174 [Microbotryomycetes sp. NB124-2]